MEKSQSLSAIKEGANRHGLKSKSVFPPKPFIPLQLSLFGDLDESIIMDDINLFNKVQNKIIPIVQAYQQLISLDRINEEQADLLEKILALSEANPILSHMLSFVDNNLPIKDEVSKQFSSQVKLEMGDDAYQAWREVRFT